MQRSCSGRFRRFTFTALMCAAAMAAVACSGGGGGGARPDQDEREPEEIDDVPPADEDETGIDGDDADPDIIDDDLDDLEDDGDPDDALDTTDEDDTAEPDPDDGERALAPAFVRGTVRLPPGPRPGAFEVRLYRGPPRDAATPAVVPAENIAYDAITGDATFFAEGLGEGADWLAVAAVAAAGAPFDPALSFTAGAPGFFPLFPAVAGADRREDIVVWVREPPVETPRYTLQLVLDGPADTKKPFSIAFFAESDPAQGGLTLFRAAGDIDQGARDGAVRAVPPPMRLWPVVTVDRCGAGRADDRLIVPAAASIDFSGTPGTETINVAAGDIACPVSGDDEDVDDADDEPDEDQNDEDDAEDDESADPDDAGDPDALAGYGVTGRVFGAAEALGRRVFVGAFAAVPAAGSAPEGGWREAGTLVADGTPYTLSVADDVAAGTTLTRWIGAVVTAGTPGAADPVAGWVLNPVRFVRGPDRLRTKVDIYVGRAPACDAGFTACNGAGDVAVCVDDVFERLAECADDACVGDRCVGCLPGVSAPRCGAEAAYACGAAGYATTPADDCAAAGRVCDAGNCRACRDGERRCDGRTPQSCTGGVFRAEPACTAGETCDGGRCVPGTDWSGTWSAAFSAREPAAGTACQAPFTVGSLAAPVIRVDDQGAISIAAVDPSSPFAAPALVRDGNRARGAATVVLDTGLADCRLGVTNTVDVTYGAGRLVGTWTLAYTPTGRGCAALRGTGGLPSPAACALDFAFNAVRYVCNAKGEELCGNGRDDDCDGLIDESRTAGGCTAPCGEGTRSCRDNALYQCVDGYTRPIRDCAAESLRCDATLPTPDCAPLCDARTEPFCDGNNRRNTCDTTSGQILQEACGVRVCVGGFCQSFSSACPTPGARTCYFSGGQAYVIACGNDNRWALQQNCSALDPPQACADAACQEPTPPTYTVPDIQDPLSARRPAEGDRIRVVDVVVASRAFPVPEAIMSPVPLGFFAREPVSGENRGIWIVLADTFTGRAPDPGTRLEVRGRYREVVVDGVAFSRVVVDTVIPALDPLPLPAPQTLPLTRLTDPARAVNFESQYVQLTSTKVASINAPDGTFALEGGLQVGNWLYKAVAPAPGAVLPSPAGFVGAVDGAYALMPAAATDVREACVGSAKRCRADTVEQCTGGLWTQVQICGADAVCDGGACVNCRAGERICAANRLYTCDNGRFADGQVCDTSGGICDPRDGACRPCPEGSRRCSGDRPQVCSGGRFVNDTACAAGTVCDRGTCVAGELLDGLWQVTARYEARPSGTTCARPPAGFFERFVARVDEGADTSLTIRDLNPDGMFAVRTSITAGDRSTLNATSDAERILGVDCTVRVRWTFAAARAADGSYAGTIDGDWTIEGAGCNDPTAVAAFPGDAPCGTRERFTMSRYVCRNFGSEVCGNGIDEDCDGFTDEADCKPACTLSERECRVTGSGTGAQEVLAVCDRGLLTELVNCTASGRVCSSGLGECTRPCAAGDALCDDGDLYLCDPVTRRYRLGPRCGAAGLICDPAGGVCAVPGAACADDRDSSCVGAAVYTCASGGWRFDRNCNTPTVCRDGACGAAPACFADADCPSGRLCHTDPGGLCLASCSAGTDCRLIGAGYECAPRGDCIFAGTQPCRTDTECPSGLRCHSLPAGGVCAADCRQSATLCASLGSFLACGGDGKCAASGVCTADRDCTTGRVCHTSLPAGPTCAPACTANADCAALGTGLRCGPERRCEPQPPCCGALRAPAAGDLAINEVLADARATDDTNGDGRADPRQDRFVEIVNKSANRIDLSSVRIVWGSTEVFRFPANASIRCGQSVVVWGGGTVRTSDFPDVGVYTAAGFDFDPLSGTIELRSAGAATLASVSWSFGQAPGASAVLDPEITGTATRSHALRYSAAYSPGRRGTRDPFAIQGACERTACLDSSECADTLRCHIDVNGGVCFRGCTGADTTCKDLAPALACGVTGLCEPTTLCPAPDRACPSGLVCHTAVGSGTCAPTCSADLDCAILGPALVCTSGRCVPRVTCTSDAQCGPNRCHTETNGGAGTCAPACADTAACAVFGANFVCDGGVCNRARCAADADCAGTPGTVCHRDVDRGKCAPACATAFDCLPYGEGYSCNAGYCTLKGARCETDVDCGTFPGTICHRDAGFVCRTACVNSPDCAWAGAEYVCNWAAGGYCNVSPSYDCSAGGCAAPNVCHKLARNQCETPCTLDADCNRLAERNFTSNYVCHPDTTLNGGTCGPACTADAACASLGPNFGCRQGRCRALYKACGSTADCASVAGTVCHTQVKGGICAPNCNGTADCAVYGSGLTCTNRLCVRDAAYDCRTQGGCTAPDVCHAQAGGKCLPGCTDDAGCIPLSGTVCHTAMGTDSCAPACGNVFGCEGFGQRTECNGARCRPLTKPCQGCPSCTSDANCTVLGAGYRCVSGACAPPEVKCTTNADCAAQPGEVCHTAFGVCGRNCSQAGGAVQSTADSWCQGRFGGQTGEFVCSLAAGLCDRSPAYVCSARNNCTPMRTCSLVSGAGACRSVCRADTDCSAVGGVCHTGADAPGCAPTCSQNSDCRIFGFNHRCTSGRCVPYVRRCKADADCGSGQVCHAGVGGGFCGTACSTRNDCAQFFPSDFGVNVPSYGNSRGYEYTCSSRKCVPGQISNQGETRPPCQDPPYTGGTQEVPCTYPNVCHPTFQSLRRCALPCEKDGDCLVIDGSLRCQTATGLCAAP